MSPTGAMKDASRALLGTYTQLLKQFTAPYSGCPISGYEDLVVNLTEEVRGLMVAMANGRTSQGGRPTPQGVGKAISPQEYQALKDGGFTDEQLRGYGYVVR